MMENLQDIMQGKGLSRSTSEITDINLLYLVQLRTASQARYFSQQVGTYTARPHPHPPIPIACPPIKAIFGVDGIVVSRLLDPQVRPVLLQARETTPAAGPPAAACRTATTAALPTAAALGLLTLVRNIATLAVGHYNICKTQILLNKFSPTRQIIIEDPLDFLSLRRLFHYAGRGFSAAASARLCQDPRLVFNLFCM
jgi:hypothetical protein